MPGAKQRKKRRREEGNRARESQFSAFYVLLIMNICKRWTSKVSLLQSKEDHNRPRKVHLQESVSGQILKKADRVLEKMLKKDPNDNDIIAEVVRIDMRARRSLNRATTLIFGYGEDRSYFTLDERGNNKKPAGPSRTIRLHTMTAEDLNKMFVQSTGDRKKYDKHWRNKLLERKFHMTCCTTIGKTRCKVRWE